ncbi:hypothetical protein [Streptomyces griseorubiginosus]
MSAVVVKERRVVAGNVVGHAVVLSHQAQAAGPARVGDGGSPLGHVVGEVGDKPDKVVVGVGGDLVGVLVGDEGVEATDSTGEVLPPFGQ